MKKIFNWILNGLKFLWFSFPKWLLYIVILAFGGFYLTKWITKGDIYTSNLVLAIILFGLIGCVIGYVALRQLYNRLFKKKKDENNDNKE